MSNVGGPVQQAIPYNVTVQPGSTPAAPVTTPIMLGDLWVYSVDFVVPPGPGGAMGFNLSYASSVILPWSPVQQIGSNTNFFIVDDWVENVMVDAEISQGLAFVGYNQGAWPHTVYMRFNATPISAYGIGVQAPVAPVVLQ
jgi:hypothetical protein